MWATVGYSNMCTLCAALYRFPTVICCALIFRAWRLGVVAKHRCVADLRQQGMPIQTPTRLGMS
ncbi:hypothetical protein BV20DRAFT_704510 [Pilatotrama ljubarskyi]|nr:hypothetical protein BV20DRAFT_704510 [Pilatotrama ljubarskyi]